MLTMKVLPTIIMAFIFLTYMFLMISNHPLIMGVSIILQAMFFAGLITYMFLLSWFSFMIFIVYLGGILMLFSYVISMIPTTKLPKKKNIILKMSMVTFFTLFFIFNFDTIQLESLFYFKCSNFKSLLFISFSSSFKMLIFMLFFLLMILIVVVFLIEVSKGNMRYL